MTRDIVIHLIVSSAVLSIALIAAQWVRPLTARTRHAILLAGLASLFFPASLIARIIERSGTTVMMPVRAVMLPVLAPTTPPPAVPSTWSWSEIAAVLWAAVAVALLLRSFVIAHRLTSTALRAGSPPPARTVGALEAARRRLSLRASVDLIASPLCEAPAVVRVLRPIIVLPPDGCESLGDDELESLLCHECAHVARRDNLIGVFEALAGALFWFNPLVWIARRRLASAREEACDERVADAAMPAETYVGALAKVCRALLAPRVAAVSCMANAHLKERIEHLMRYDTLRASALSHRGITAAASAIAAILIFAGGVLVAAPSKPTSKLPFQLNIAIGRVDAAQLIFHADIIDTATNESVGRTTFKEKAGVPAASEIHREDRRWRIEADTQSTGDGTVTLIAWADGIEVQRTSVPFKNPQLRSEPKRTYTGQDISLDLGNADIRDVLRTFGQLTGLEMDLAPTVSGVVSAHFVGVPWDQALDELLRQNGYTWRLEGNKLSVFPVKQ